MADAEPRYLTLEEAAVLLRVTPPTLARWAKEGNVPAYRTPGGHWRFVAEDLLLALGPARTDNRNRGRR